MYINGVSYCTNHREPSEKDFHLIDEFFIFVSPGVQSYVKPSGKTNRKLIINAVTHVCLPGVVNKETKEKCLQVCEKLAKISGMFERVRLATLRVFQVVQTQTTTAYCRILPALDHHV